MYKSDGINGTLNFLMYLKAFLVALNIAVIIIKTVFIENIKNSLRAEWSKSLWKANPKFRKKKKEHC